MATCDAHVLHKRGVGMKHTGSMSADAGALSLFPARGRTDTNLRSIPRAGRHALRRRSSGCLPTTEKDGPIALALGIHAIAISTA